MKLRCEKTEVVLAAIKQSNEQIEWIARTDGEDDIATSMWYSEKDDTYTLIMTQGEYSCVLNTGHSRINARRTYKPNT